MEAGHIINYINNNIIEFGSYASVLGLLVTFFGFVVTIRNVRKSKQASEEAANKAKEIGRTVFLVDKISEVERA